MNILFLTTGRMQSIEQHAIYPDLLRCFRNHGHQIYIVSSYEKRIGRNTEYLEENGAHMLRVKIGNLTKTNTIEKGISTLLIEKQYLSAVKQYLSNVQFDLVLYSTPPITLVKVVEYIKERDDCKTYLLLKDIFPQNAVDLGMISTHGVKSIVYRYFRSKEKKLYAISDFIGCMSQANVEYMLTYNPDIKPEKVEVCPNCIEVVDASVTEKAKITIRKKYKLPLDKLIFIYGGNLGRPQGIPFLMECRKSLRKYENIFLLIVGDGTEYSKLKTFIGASEYLNVKLMKHLPKEDYDSMVGACDVGMIFLDHRFTIPNFPSRLLAYMQASIPVLACTDPNTDIGNVIVKGGFGWWCESDNVKGFEFMISEIIKADLKAMGKNGFNYLKEHYTSEIGYSIIMKYFENM